MSGHELAAAAQGLIGARFRLNGRDRDTGLDCLGVVAAALAAIGRPATLPVHCSLRQRGPVDGDRLARAAGLVNAEQPIAPGDVLLVRCSPVQLHLLVALGPERFVHAHAGLGRVVAGMRDPAWTMAGHWRLPATTEDT